MIRAGSRTCPQAALVSRAPLAKAGQGTPDERASGARLSRFLSLYSCPVAFLAMGDRYVVG